MDKMREELERTQATLGKAQLQQEKLQNSLDKAQNEVDHCQEKLDKATGEIRRVKSTENWDVNSREWHEIVYGNLPFFLNSVPMCKIYIIILCTI